MPTAADNFFLRGLRILPSQQNSVGFSQGGSRLSENEGHFSVAASGPRVLIVSKRRRWCLRKHCFSRRSKPWGWFCGRVMI
jgi:hypothetical protein